MILPCSVDSVIRIAEYAKFDPVVLPTDTLYGLSMSIYGPTVKIYRLKKRPQDKRFPVGVADLEMMRTVAEVTPAVERLVRKFMPGPLTVVARSRVPEITGETIGVRIPDHFVPIALMRELGPITLTSANISGEPAPVKVEDTMRVDVEYRIDCGTLSGVPSTVVSVVDGIKLIRQGAIPFSAILKVAGEQNGP